MVLLAQYDSKTASSYGKNGHQKQLLNMEQGVGR